MTGLRSFVWFVVLTFASTWACWIAANALSGRSGTASLAIGGLVLLGTIAPSLVALALTARREGRAAVQTLLRRVTQSNVGLRWYVFAVGFMPAIKLSVALIHRVITGAWPRFGDESWYLMAGAILISTWVQAGEEIGWRGYALPSLSRRVGLAQASLILGVVWASWHLPLFVMLDSDKLGQSFPIYLVQVTALSVAAAWLYWRTDGSLLLVMIFHAAANNTKDIVPSAVPGASDPLAFSPSPVAWLTVAMLWVAAVFFLVQLPKAPGPVQAFANAPDAPRHADLP